MRRTRKQLIADAYDLLKKVNKDTIDSYLQGYEDGYKDGHRYSNKVSTIDVLNSLKKRYRSQKEINIDLSHSDHRGLIPDQLIIEASIHNLINEVIEAIQNKLKSTE